MGFRQPLLNAMEANRQRHAQTVFEHTTSETMQAAFKNYIEKLKARKHDK